MSCLPASKGCRFRPSSLESFCRPTQLALEGESHNRRPDCSHDHQEVHEVDFPTSRLKASKQTEMQKQNAQRNKEYAAALDETKLECWFVHLLILAKRTNRRSITAVIRPALTSRTGWFQLRADDAITANRHRNDGPQSLSNCRAMTSR